MGILNRFKDIMASNINALLDKCEDPEKMIDQTLRNLREDYAEVKKETANIMADEKAAARKVDDMKKQIAQADAAARNALKAGNEADARTIIAKKQQYEEQLVSLDATYAVAKENADKMRQMTAKLQADIETLETRKDAIKAKVKVAKAQKTINKTMSGTVKSEASIEAFERMEAKANKMLDAAQAEAELNADAASSQSLINKYASGGNTAAVDDELAAMKASLGL